MSIATPVRRPAALLLALGSTSSVWWAAWITVCSLAAPALAVDPPRVGGQDISHSSDVSSVQPPRFPARVELVIVDVVVVDKRDSSVTGLSARDFEVTEDGVRQQVVSFEAVTFPAPQAVPGLAGASEAVAGPAPERRATGRSFAVVFDDLNITPFKAGQAKAAVRAFIDSEVQDGDRIVLLTTSGSVMETGRGSAPDSLATSVDRIRAGLIPYLGPDRIADYEAMQIHVFRDPEVEGRVQRRLAQRAGATGSSSIKLQAAEVYRTAAARIETTLGAVERLLISMKEAGRKSVILVSEGFFGDPRSDAPKRVVLAAMQANVAIYFVDVRGLELGETGYSAEYNQLSDAKSLAATLADEANATHGAESLAEDTGGFTIRNTNDLAAGMKRIADEARAYYLVGYSPSRASKAGKFRKIRVKVNREGIHVRARRGYYAPQGAGGP